MGSSSKNQQTTGLGQACMRLPEPPVKGCLLECPTQHEWGSHKHPAAAPERKDEGNAHVFMRLI
jgi:hypothetical protein